MKNFDRSYYLEKTDVFTACDKLYKSRSREERDGTAYFLKKKISYFKDLPVPLIFDLGDMLSNAFFPKGSVIMNEGEVGSCMYIIVEGEVCVSVDGERIATLGRN